MSSITTPHKNSLAPMYGVLLVQQSIAASTHFIAKYANQGADPFTIVFVRGVITVVAFAVILFLQRKQLRPVEREDWRLIVFLGLLNIPCNQLLFVAGLRYTIPPNAALAYALVPAFVLLFSVMFFGEKTTIAKTLGVALAFAGTLVVIFERGLDFTSTFFLGNMMELCAAVSWAWYSLLGRKLALKYGASFATGLTMIVGMAWYSVIFPFLPTTAPLLAMDGMTLMYAGYLALISSVLGYWLWYVVLARIPASNAAVFSNLQPVMVTVFSVLVLGTNPSAVFFVGGALVLVGVLLTQRG
ncbi:MAG: DMT family transporter [Candidatus Kapabacteria bacterium]|nr:DMT family transporter [Candidatus Kapabacteria bacterium]